MMLYMSMKFHENILNGFQVVEGTQNYDCRISQGNNSKNVLTRVMVLVLCTLSDDALYFYEVSYRTRVTVLVFCTLSDDALYLHENILNGFRVIEQTQNYHCQISKGNDSKTI